jgi:mono/diheme cytochrome c family protein
VARLIRSIIGAIALAGFALYWLSGFDAYSVFRSDGRLQSSRAPNAANGEVLFAAGGCVSCHVSPDTTDRRHVGGGLPLKTPFGTFYPPNISSDPIDGIGAWSDIQFIRALREGTAPDRHSYYPAFPYPSYRHLSPEDAADLFAYIKTLPAVKGKTPDHDLAFPYSVRRGLGLWKLVFLNGTVIDNDPQHSPAWNRGHYLVEGVGHFAECHSPRNLAGAVLPDKRLSGGPNIEGKGFVPNLTPDKTGLANWSEAEIASLLKDGFTPDFDSVGSSMADVVRNTATLSDADRLAMATYLKSLPPLTGQLRTK